MDHNWEENLDNWKKNRQNSTQSSLYSKFIPNEEEFENNIGKAKSKTFGEMMQNRCARSYIYTAEDNSPSNSLPPTKSALQLKYENELLQNETIEDQVPPTQNPFSLISDKNVNPYDIKTNEELPKAAPRRSISIKVEEQTDVVSYQQIDNEIKQPVTKRERKGNSNPRPYSSYNPAEPFEFKICETKTKDDNYLSKTCKVNTESKSILAEPAKNILDSKPLSNNNSKFKQLMNKFESKEDTVKMNTKPVPIPRKISTKQAYYSKFVSSTETTNKSTVPDKIANNTNSQYKYGESERKLSPINILTIESENNISVLSRNKSKAPAFTVDNFPYVLNNTNNNHNKSFESKEVKQKEAIVLPLLTNQHKDLKLNESPEEVINVGDVVKITFDSKVNTYNEKEKNINNQLMNTDLLEARYVASPIRAEGASSNEITSIIGTSSTVDNTPQKSTCTLVFNPRNKTSNEQIHLLESSNMDKTNKEIDKIRKNNENKYVHKEYSSSEQNNKTIINDLEKSQLQQADNLSIYKKFPSLNFETKRKAPISEAEIIDISDLKAQDYYENEPIFTEKNKITSEDIFSKPSLAKRHSITYPKDTEVVLPNTPVIIMDDTMSSLTNQTQYCRINSGVERKTSMRNEGNIAIIDIFPEKLEPSKKEIITEIEKKADQKPIDLMLNNDYLGNDATTNTDTEKIVCTDLENVHVNREIINANNNNILNQEKQTSRTIKEGESFNKKNAYVQENISSTNMYPSNDIVISSSKPIRNENKGISININESKENILRTNIDNTNERIDIKTDNEDKIVTKKSFSDKQNLLKGKIGLFKSPEELKSKSTVKSTTPPKTKPKPQSGSETRTNEVVRRTSTNSRLKKNAYIDSNSIGFELNDIQPTDLLDTSANKAKSRLSVKKRPPSRVFLETPFAEEPAKNFKVLPRLVSEDVKDADDTNNDILLHMAQKESDLIEAKKSDENVYDCDNNFVVSSAANFVKEDVNETNNNNQNGSKERELLISSKENQNSCMTFDDDEKDEADDAETIDDVADAKFKDLENFKTNSQFEISSFNLPPLPTSEPPSFDSDDDNGNVPQRNSISSNNRIEFDNMTGHYV